jgi:putative tryptophan/tyrosine transport system substrate-binding protein
MMNRRTLIPLVGGAFLALPLQVCAQQPGRTYRIGFLYSRPREAPQHIALFDKLRRLGFIEGQNLIIEPLGFGLPVSPRNGFS